MTKELTDTIRDDSSSLRPRLSEERVRSGKSRALPTAGKKKHSQLHAKKEWERSWSVRTHSSAPGATVEFPQLHFIDKVVNIPAVAQRQISMNRTVQKTIEIHQLQFIDKVVDVLVVLVVQVPQVQVVEKTVEIPR